MEIIFAVIHEKGWGQEGQLRSCCSNSGMTELVISRATKGAHPRDISRASAVGLLILDIRNEGGGRVKENFHSLHIWGRNMLISY